MEHISSLFSYDLTPTIFKTERQELVADFVSNINLLRGKKYKPITPKEVSLRLNSNPFLAKSDQECRHELNRCLEKGNFSHFFWICPLNKKQK